jgi:hypothetical protein
MIAMVSLTWKKKAYNYQIKFLIWDNLLSLLNLLIKITSLNFIILFYKS